jgi:transposase InsO family protein
MLMNARKTSNKTTPNACIPARVFSEEFKREAVALLQSSGRTASQLSRELGYRPGAPRWISTRPSKSATPAEGRGVSTWSAQMDLYSRRIVGWAVADHLESSLVLLSLQRALHARPLRDGHLLHHSDQGCQYTSRAFSDFLQRHQIRPSMSRRGNCYDNAAMESFCPHGKPNASARSFRQPTFKPSPCFLTVSKRSITPFACTAPSNTHPL